MKSGTFNKIIMRGGTLDVNGTILCGNEVLSGGTSNSGFINRLAGTLNFGPGSLVEFNRTSGINSAMPLATWDATSTIRVINCTGATGLTSWSAGTHSLGNVVIDASGMNIPVYNLGFSSATALLVNEIKGDFTVLNANGKIITLAAITAANNTQAQTINFRGNISVSNTAEFRAFNYTGSGSGSGTATWNFEKNVTLPLVGVSINSGTAHTMNFTGAVPQTLNLSGFATNGIFSLTVNNAGNGVTLNNNTGNLKNITLTNGKLTLGNFNVFAGYNSGTVSATAGSWIVTNGTGVLTVNNITAGNTLPIGNAKYNPVLIENGSGHSWSAKVSDGITADPGFNTDKAVLVTWEITPSVNPPAAGVDITFQFDETTQTGPLFNIGTNIQAWRRPSSIWITSGAPSAAGGTVGARSVKITGLTGFSSYGLSNIDGPLPVSLLSFSGERRNTNNVLSWSTATEVNNLGFEVNRSVDGVNYTLVGFVNTKAPGGNSTNLLNYSFTDINPVGKKHYYRLRQIDIDNHSRLSNIVLIKGDIPLTLTIEGLFPNPASSVLNVILHSATRETVTLAVTDVTGRILKRQIANTESGSNTLSIDLTTLKRGYYTIKASSVSTGETTTAKFIKY
ncbi:MAG: T9SS type A sorting domain-containing protein [Chitinophagaceae bacterium]